MNNNRFESKETLGRINKIDFLVHPGYIYESLLGDNDSAEKSGLIDLFHAYLIKAQEIPEDEILCAIAPAFRKKMKADLSERSDDYHYGQLLRDLRDILGDRLVVFSDNHNLALKSTGGEDIHHGSEMLQDLRRILNARGMDFDESTMTEAYGEYLFACVSLVAERLNKSGNFISPTIIRTKLTELITEYGKSSKEVVNLAGKDSKTLKKSIRYK